MTYIKIIVLSHIFLKKHAQYDFMDENLVYIEFPRKLNYEEVRGMCRYIALKIPSADLNFNLERIERFGNKFLPTPKSMADLTERIITQRISGNISQREPFGMADFYLDSEFGEDNIVYTSLNFTLTPGTRLGELKSDSKEIMLEVRNILDEYFILNKIIRPK